MYLLFSKKKIFPTFLALLVTQLAPNPNGEIIINNAASQKCQLGLYKDYLLVMKKNDVDAGSRAVFQIKPKLCFGLTKKIREGCTFLLQELPYEYITVDLVEFSTDFKICVHADPSSDRLHFQVEQY